MSNTLKFGNGEWYGKKDTILAYNDENSNFKPLPFSFDRASSATVVNKAGLIETVGSGEPRIDYKDDSKGALLLENSATNVIINSEDFTGSEWVLYGYASGDAPILTSNYDTSPDGKQNATRLQFNLNGGTTTTDRSYIRYNSFASQTDYYYSCYVKSANGQEQKLLWQHGGDDNEFTVTNEWQRVELDRNGNAETFTGFSLRGGISTVDTADVLVWGFQVEQRSYATSYIPTQGSAVTRIGDVCNNGGNDQVINSTEGVLYAEISALANDGTTRTISLNDNSGSNVIRISNTTTSNEVNFIVRANSNIYVYNQVLSDITTINKLAISYSSSGAKVFINGILSDSGALSSLPTGLSQLDFRYGNGTLPFYGNVKDVRVYNTTLTDAELISLTSL